MKKICSYILSLCTLLNMFVVFPNVNAKKISNEETNSTIVEYVPDSSIVINSKLLSKNFDNSVIRGLSFINCKDKPLYRKGMPKVEDIRQNQLGVCYFLSAVSSVLAVDPQIIVNCLEDQNDGTVIANLYDPYSGKLHKIRVDKSIPDLNDNYSFLLLNSPLWIHILLKAFVASKLYASSRNYAALEGGWTAPMLRMLTGKEAYAYNGISLGFMGKKRLLKRISDAINNKCSVGCIFSPQTTYGKKQLLNFDTNKELVTDHAYSVIGVHENWVKFRNPWGKDSTSKNGIHVMHINTFYKCCSEIEVSTSDPIKKRGYIGKIMEEKYSRLPFIFERTARVAAKIGYEILKFYADQRKIRTK